MSLILQEDGTSTILLENSVDRLLQEDDADSTVAPLFLTELEPTATHVMLRPTTTLVTPGAMP